MHHGYDSRDGTQIVVKVIDLVTDKREEESTREIRVLSVVSHPDIARLYYTVKEDHMRFLMMEYLPGKDLFSLITREPRCVQIKARSYFQQLLSGVEYLHQHGIVHRDLKLENILLSADKTRLVIADFGLSGFVLDDKPLTTYCGTPHYVAPELVLAIPYRGQPADMWALGVILYVMLTSAYPFDASDLDGLYRRIVRSTPRFPKCIPTKALPVIEGLLEKDPVKR